MLENGSLLAYPADAAKIIGVGKSTFFELRKKESFPKPVYPFGKRPMFLVEDLEKWAKSLKSQ